MLGGEGGGLEVVRAVNHGVPHLQTAALLASLKSLLETTAAHCRFSTFCLGLYNHSVLCSARTQFERVLADLPLVRDRLGRMAGQLYGLESMVLTCRTGCPVLQRFVVVPDHGAGRLRGGHRGGERGGEAVR